MYETKNLNSNTARRGAGVHRLWAAGTAIAFTLCLTIVGSIAGADAGTWTSGDDLGSLPGVGGGGGWPVGRADTRPALTLEAEQVSQVSSAVLEVEGEGDVDVLELSNGNIRYMFRGNLRVRIDEAALEANDVKMGLFASNASGAVLTQAVFDGQAFSPVTVQPGSTLDLPLQRMQDAGMLDAAARIRTFHQDHLDGDLQLYSQQGMLTAVMTD